MNPSSEQNPELAGSQGPASFASEISRAMSSVQVWSSARSRLNLSLPKSRVSPQCVVSFIESIRVLCPVERVFLLVHAERLRAFAWDAATALVSEDFSSRVGAIGFVVGASQDARDALQLFTYFHRPAYPLRVFDSVEKADRWLTVMEKGAAAAPYKGGGVLRFPPPVTAN